MNIWLISIFGLILTSFYVALAYRLRYGLNWITGFSFCPKCGHRLSFYDLIPLGSYFMLKGRCRYCKQRISFLYPLGEISGLLVINYLYFKTNSLFYSLAEFNYLAILVVLAYEDYYHQEFSAYFFIPLLIIGLLNRRLELLIFLIPLSLIILNLIIRDSFGLGDIILFLLIGLRVGLTNQIRVFILSIVLGGIGAGYYLLVVRERNKRIAFGPYIFMGYLLNLAYTL